MQPLARVIAIAGATAAWIGIAIALYLNVTGPLGAAGGVWRLLAFFTILTNTIAGCLFTMAVTQTPKTRGAAKLYTAVAAYMVFLGIFYIVVLQRVVNPQGLNLVIDILLHYVTPALFLLYWFLAVPKGSLTWTDPFSWLAYPLGYIAYALARGAIDGFYPYAVINAAELGYARVALNVVVLIAVFLALATAFVAIGRLQARAQS